MVRLTYIIAMAALALSTSSAANAGDARHTGEQRPALADGVGAAKHHFEGGTGTQLYLERAARHGGDRRAVRRERKRSPVGDDEIVLRGVAIECRINAENPDKNFQPNPGKIERLFTPGGLGVRFDSHVYGGYAVPPYYDSMIGKLIVGKGGEPKVLAQAPAAGSKTYKGIGVVTLSNATTSGLSPILNSLVVDRLLGHTDKDWLGETLEQMKMAEEGQEQAEKDKAKKPKPAVFPHAKHQEVAKCADCHHSAKDGKQIPYEEGQEVGKCEDCHYKGSEMPKKLDSFKGAAHVNCKDCHKKVVEEKPELAEKFAKCMPCHPKS